MAPTLHADQIEAAAKWTLEPFERQGGGEGPYKIQYDLQDMMQDLVGIVRKEEEMRRALEGIRALAQRVARVRVTGNREYNPGWHTALDLDNLLVVAEMVARSALERKESRGAQFREDYPDKDESFGRVNLVVRKSAEGEFQLSRRPIPEMPEELKKIIQEMA